MFGLEEGADVAEEVARAPYFKPGDGLFHINGEAALPAVLTGVRPARHLFIWEGYFQAADLLVDSCVEDPRRSLRLVYPILFAYRHAVEVALKFTMDFYGDDLAPRSHSLGILWSHVRTIMMHHCDVTLQELDCFGEIVAELDAADRSSTAFRYTWPKREIGEEEFQAVDYPLDREDVPLDLAVVRSAMDKVQRFLEEMDFCLMNLGIDRRD